MCLPTVRAGLQRKLLLLAMAWTAVQELQNAAAMHRFVTQKTHRGGSKASLLDIHDRVLPAADGPTTITFTVDKSSTRVETLESMMLYKSVSAMPKAVSGVAAEPAGEGAGAGESTAYK